MKRIGTPCFTIASILFLAFAASSIAWGANGKITGRVIERETGQPLPSAIVMITGVISPTGAEVPLDRPLGASSDIDGYYFIMNVSPGTYAMRVSQVGYAPVVKKNIHVESDRTITINFDLASSAVQVEQVVVTAQREIVRKDVSATQEIVIPTKMQEMPVVRVDEFVGRLKGVELVSNADGNGLAVRGGAIRETDIRLDGMSLQDPRSDNSYLAFNSTTIQEIQVLTGGFEAKYGGIRSGLLNVVTKDGSRDRYTAALKVDIAPANQKRSFGTDPYSNDSWIYKIYSGKYAMHGAGADSLLVPKEFRSFKGWTANISGLGDYNYLDSTQRLDLWNRTHPQYSYRDKQDVFMEGSITGPLPSVGIPFWGDYADRTTFLLGFKYENSQLAFPLGPRDNYLDWNTQLKLTSQLADNLKLSINGMYANIQTNSGGGTSSYGGSLVDASSTNSFLNSTPSSVARQANLIAGSQGMLQMFNKSRLQYFDQRYIVGGVKLTNTFSAKGFFTLDFQAGYTDQNLAPFAEDTSRSDAWITYYSAKYKKTVRFQNAPSLGSPNGSTNIGTDVLGTFDLYGGAQHADSSHSMVYQLKGDMTLQLGRHHQFDAGFSARIQDIFVYSGTWYQSQISFTPDLWQYYKATPLDLGAYVQDKLEFDGVVINAGLRLDVLDPMKKGYLTGFPVTEAYKDFYNSVYLNTAGAWGSYERWLNFRTLLENPTGWPQTENRIQAYLSPRLGVSFPITDASKMYFNYGHFYQRPPTAFMYSQNIYVGSVAVPTPNLDMALTVSYEFGYEQMFLDDFVVNVAAYYKDNRNEPLARAFVNYYHDNDVVSYFPDAYSDIRGVEVRVERPVGTYVSFYGMYDYSLYSGGQSGLSTVYEDRLEAKTEGESRSATLYSNDPRPRANFTLNLHTPKDFGPSIFGVDLLGRLMCDVFFEWRSGGRYLWNPDAQDVKDRLYVDAINTWNVDLRGSKMFDIGVGELELVLTVKNLTNNKWLSIDNLTREQLTDYKNSLKPSFILDANGKPLGNDKWGQYKSDDNHIVLPWFDAPLFLNPRMILLGARLNF
jgi:hypothetical protein